MSNNNTTKNKVLRAIGYVVTAVAVTLIVSMSATFAVPWMAWGVGVVAAYALWYWHGAGAFITKESSSRKIYLTLAGSVALLMVALIPVARMAGAEAAKQSKERLVLVWPNLMQMPEYDRAFVVALAMNCRLQKRPAIKAEVIACLKEGAADKRGTFPVGLDRASAPGRLDQMLAVAGNESQQGERHE